MTIIFIPLSDTLGFPDTEYEGKKIYILNTFMRPNGVETFSYTAHPQL